MLLTVRAAAFGFFVAGILGLPASAEAGTIVGGSTLLTASDLDQLETWLGEGELTLTNIFTASDGDGLTSTHFHTRVDNQGRTFVVLEVKANSAYSSERGTRDHERQIIGGYNPLSWDSHGHYHTNPTNAGRTAFLFNLNNDVKYDQKQDASAGNYGSYQTVGHEIHGPTFGGGHDLYVSSDLTSGYTRHWSYGPGFDTDDILTDDGYFHEGRMFGTIEVFTIAQQQASPVPEASSLIAWSIVGLVCGSGCWWRRCRQVRAAT
ncbi:MAG: PEP_CTERM-anchored TLD domain-containing protein [Pirellulales bacterium]